MNRLRRHSAFVLLAVLLIGGLPVLHAAQHAVEYAQTAAPASPAASDEAPGASASEADAPVLAAHATVSEQPTCDLCAHTLYGAPIVTQPTASLHEAISEKTRLRSRVVQATPYHFVIRGPPARA